MTDATPKAHAKYSASASKRWLSCPGSVQLSVGAPPKPESEYALEGTLAHSCLEIVLKDIFKRDLDLPVILKSLREMQLFPKEIIDNVAIAAKYIKEKFYLDHIHAVTDVSIEEKIDCSFLFPNTFGTGDFCAVQEFGKLSIVDYKHGAGVAVDIHNNSQLLFYALGLAHKFEYNFAEIELTIIQPRADHSDGPIRTWVTDIDTLLAWKDKFIKGIKACEKPNADLASGDHCRWCPASAYCPEISTKALDQAMIDFAPSTGELALPQVTNRTPVKFLPQALDAAKKLEVWIKALRQTAFDALNRGEIVLGWKLVDKKSTRRWVNLEHTSDIAFDLFGGESFDNKLKSPRQLELTFGRELVKDFINENTTDISTGVTLVRSTDPRPAAISSAQSDFDDGYLGNSDEASDLNNY